MIPNFSASSEQKEKDEEVLNYIILEPTLGFQLDNKV